MARTYSPQATARAVLPSRTRLSPDPQVASLLTSSKSLLQRHLRDEDPLTSLGNLETAGTFPIAVISILPSNLRCWAGVFVFVPCGAQHLECKSGRSASACQTDEVGGKCQKNPKCFIVNCIRYQTGYTTLVYGLKIDTHPNTQRPA